MAKKTANTRKSANLKEFPAPDTTPDTPQPVVAELPSYPVVIGAQTFKLCFDLDELEKAEVAFKAQGHRVNMLFALDVGALNLQSLRVLFAGAVRTFHPEVSFEQARALITIGSIYVVTAAVLNAFADAKEKEFQLLPAAVKADVEAAAAAGAGSAEAAGGKGEGKSE